ncbi:hypothetical protein FF011L_26860 [Roseimaritima multifibrata]|uniref:Uncharacterized protein n=1 Tax=Roseimaritima multifibrata TaxID=1930274 RepID=A0A517MGA9_9BACT|nr:hypothetical protein [Roseimaritima multifibrata]QDS93909.1 hypothetical protein FF011L_26860 [Roseimaritima multifibrata]
MLGMPTGGADVYNEQLHSIIEDGMVGYVCGIAGAGDARFTSWRFAGELQRCDKRPKYQTAE